MLATATNDDAISVWDTRYTTKPIYAWRPGFATCRSRARVIHKITDLRWDPSSSGELLASYAEGDLVLLRPSASEIGNEDDVVQTFQGHANEKTMVRQRTGWSNYFAA
jgi:hypothetical protein